MKQLLRLMRIKHFVKNGLILLPLLFSGQMNDGALLVKALLGVVAFSLVSSAVYIFNDVMDAERDRSHPTKCQRPIASGAVSVRAAWLLAVALLVAAAVVNFFIADMLWLAWLVPCLYLLLNVAYSLGLKNVPIVDIAILVSGFVLRVIYGSVLTGIEISRWLYLTVIAMSFYLGLGKRRNELLRQTDGSTRAVLQHYTHSFLDKNMYVCLALTIVFYSLWSVDALTIARVGSNRLLWTVPLVILICMRYSLTIEGSSDGDPVEVLFTDKMLLALCGLLGLAIVGLLYFF